VLPLPESTETFLATRSQNYRKKFGEYERRSRRDLDATFRVCLTEDDRRRDMASLVKLHQQRWTGQSGAFRSDRYIEFHDRFSARLLERGWLRLFTVERRSTPVAVLYCFMYCGRYSFYQAGRDPDFGKYRMGLLIMHKAILEAIKEGATVFDFLRGTEPYKYRWAEFNITNCRLMYWRNLRAQMKGSLQDALRQLRLAR
jgi:CelD/BcsL family acetyltransferase involved in cellulose biosynthesis